MATTDDANSAEEGQSCLGCQCGAKAKASAKGEGQTCQILAGRVASARRLIILLTAITGGLCVLTIVACACSVYLYSSMLAMRTEILLAVGKGAESGSEDYDYTYDPEYLTGQEYEDADYQASLHEMQADDASQLRTGKKKGKKRGCKGGGKSRKAACKCCVRKIRSLISSGEMKLPTTEAKQQTTTQAPKKTSGLINEHPPFIGAAHYASVVDNAYVEAHLPPIDQAHLADTVKCKNISEWSGRLCRNRTFSASEAPVTLKMFGEAKWMTNATRIFDYRPQDGSFVARYTGIYLLYAHVLFYDVKTKQALGLLHESAGSGGADDAKSNQFRCMESVDHVDTERGFPDNARYKSCSVNGVVYAKQGDTVKVQNLYANTEMDLSGDATYFGGVLFSLR